MAYTYISNKQKALRINLDSNIYGSFAEIGAGQEVAANFFKAGSASGTIAKTMSAYDMAFSNAIYGPSPNGRYVSENRLLRMLEKEFELLPERLPNRVHETRFFAFADTVEALNYRKTNQGHGWLGVRFLLKPNVEPNDCVIHILLHDNDTFQQQQALGIIGVNLIYACYFYHDDQEAFLKSLMDDMGPGRIEIDFFKLDGADFMDFDNRLFSLKLVKSGFSNATMFGPDGEILQPADELYKKNVLIARGRFRPLTHVNLDMIETAYRQFSQEPSVDKNKIKVISELSLSNLKTKGEDQINEKDFLDRVDILCSLGQTVMISNYHEYYRLAQYISRLTKSHLVGIVLGIHNLASIFDEKYYSNLQGGILSSFGMLFGGSVKLYVYPALAADNVNLYNCDNFELPFHLFGLFRYLYDNEKVEDLREINANILHIISDNVLAMIQSGTSGWEDMVPKAVAEQIKTKKLFNYPG
jgi:hypothetical protein